MWIITLRESKINTSSAQKEDIGLNGSEVMFKVMTVENYPELLKGMILQIENSL